MVRKPSDETRVMNFRLKLKAKEAKKREEREAKEAEANAKSGKAQPKRTTRAATTTVTKTPSKATKTPKSKSKSKSKSKPSISFEDLADEFGGLEKEVYGVKEIANSANDKADRNTRILGKHAEAIANNTETSKRQGKKLRQLKKIVSRLVLSNIFTALTTIAIFGGVFGRAIVDFIQSFFE